MNQINYIDNILEEKGSHKNARVLHEKYDKLQNKEIFAGKKQGCCPREKKKKKKKNKNVIT